MDRLAFTFCLVMFLISFLLEPKKLNPMTIFFGEWAIIILLAILNLYSLEKASDFIYGYMLLGCIFFALGFYLLRLPKKRYRFSIGSRHGDKGDVIFILNKSVLYCLGGLTVVFFIIDSITSAINLLQGNALDYIRQQAQGGFQYTSNALMNAIRILIATPVSFAMMPLAAIEFFKKDRNWLIIWTSAIIAVLRVVADGGRTPFIFLALCFIICYFYQNDKTLPKAKKESLATISITKRKKYFFVAAIIGIIFLWYVTLSRSGDRTIRYTYYYFAMEPIMFEKWAARTDSAGLLGYGMASFNGFLFPLFYFITNVLQIPYPNYWRSIYNMVESVGTDWQVITTQGLTANSYATAFWNLYLDGRVFGIMVGMFLYGMFVARVYKNVIYHQNEKNLSIFCLVVLGVFYSFQFMLFENMYYALAFLLIQFLLYKTKSVEEAGSRER